MRRILASTAVVIAAGAFLVLTLGSSSKQPGSTYRIELDNAFGLVNGADFKVAGVNAGTIKSITLDQKTLHAVVTVNVTQKGFGQFRSDVFCESRPQSLIGEYFVDCNPGISGRVLRSGSTIPVTHTQSTIPADLVQNIMQLPYRQRFSILINELGAAVAARSEDLQSALRRADPALAQTDNLLALLANDAQTIKSLNAGANSVITALANNSKQVQDFIVQANQISTDSATQASNIQATWQKLPSFLAQLRPAMAKLGAAADAQDPVLVNLNEASANLKRFFTDLVPFSHSSAVSLACGESGAPSCPAGGASLGSASAVGKPAVQAATPLVAHLNQFSQNAPELAQNLAIVLHTLDNRSRAVEADPRSPGGGAGYTGLEAILQYVFNQTLAINYFGPFGHLLGVDAFANTVCSPYTTPQMLANNLASYAAGQSTVNPRSCYAFLGPHQPGVTEPDPTFNQANANPAQPSACVPDPGGAPIFPGYNTHYTGASTSACKLAATPAAAKDHANARKPAAKPKAAPPNITAVSKPKSGGPPINLQQTISQIISGITGATGPIRGLAGAATGALHGATGVTGPTGATGASATNGASSGLTATQTQQLLNYLLAP